MHIHEQEIPSGITGFRTELPSPESLSGAGYHLQTPQLAHSAVVAVEPQSGLADAVRDQRKVSSSRPPSHPLHFAATAYATQFVH